LQKIQFTLPSEADPHANTKFGQSVTSAQGMGSVERVFVAEYEGVIRACIHALKYDHNQSLGEFFSPWMGELVAAMNWEVDLVVPVPLSEERVRMRGYNQSELLARPLALHLGIRYLPICVSRIRNTPSQVGLSASERRINVAGAFLAIPELVTGRRILLVDDVSTTGATLAACSNAVFLAGGSKVYCITLAGFTHWNLISSEVRHQV
jgi:ComF family protein